MVALLGGNPLATLAFHELGIARMLGKHIVLRSMRNVDDQKAVDSYDALSAEERAGFSQRRKRHKEAAVLLHEIGHTLGALHTIDRQDLMHAIFDPDMQSIEGPNLHAMRLSLTYRTFPVAEQDPAKLLVELKALFEADQGASFVPEERSKHLAWLTSALSTSTTAPEPHQATAESPPKAGKAADLAGLSAEDVQLYESIDSLREKAESKKLHQALKALATRYPDSYAVQEKACATGMQIGLSHRELRSYCDRMTALSLQAPAAAQEGVSQ